MRYIHKVKDKFCVGILKGENNVAKLSFAHCTREDNYARKRARQIVDGRMEKNSGVISFYTELDEMQIWRAILDFLQRLSDQSQYVISDKRGVGGPIQYNWEVIVKSLFGSY